MNWKFLAAGTVVFGLILSAGADNFSFRIYDGNNKRLKVEDGHLYNAPCLHIVVYPETFRAADYKYRYLKGKSSSEKLKACPERPFFQDIFMYRLPEDQWMRLEVTAKDGTRKVLAVGIKGGELKAPPDKPLTGIEYAKGMMNGHVTQGVEKWVNETSEEELEEKDVLKWKRLGFKSVRINMAPSLAFLQSPDPKYGKDWNHLLEKYVDILLRHGQYVFFSRFGHWAKEDKYKVKGSPKTPEEYDKAMKVILDDDTKWWTTLVKFWRFKSHKLSYEFFVEAKKKTFPSYAGMLNHYYARITPKIRAVDPTRVLIFTATRHNFMFINGLVIPKSAGPYAMSQAHKGFLGSDPKFPTLKGKMELLEKGTKWANAHGIPVILGAATSWAGDNEFTPELCRYLEAISGKLNDNKVPCPITWWANDDPMAAQAEQNYRFIINPDDIDADGLSNAEEKKLGTSPDDIDTDHDNITDKTEVDTGLDPKDIYDGFSRESLGINGDIDGDGIGNAYEIKTFQNLKKNKKPLDSFNPKVADSDKDYDGDGVSNLWERITGLKPFTPFSQVHSAGSWRRISGLSAAEKAKYNDANRDDDGDGMSNLEEIKSGRWPMDKRDTDKDGLKENDPIPYVSDKEHIMMLVFDDGIVNDAPAAPLLKAVKRGKTVFAAGAPRGKAVSFASSDACVSLPGSEQMNPARLEQRSVSLRFRLHNTRGVQVLFVQGNKDSGLVLYAENGVLYGGIWNKNAKQFLKIGKISADKWYHTVLNIDTGRCDLRGFLNGRKTVSAHLQSAFGNWGVPYGKNNSIGNTLETVMTQSGSVSSGVCAGEIDELNIYNRILSEVDISRLARTDLPIGR